MLSSTLLKLPPPPASNGAVTPKPPSVTVPCNRLTACHSVTDKLNNLASEFRSLTEPIDRVKRLLYYASLLPPMDRFDRVPENRVTGCTTQVWVVARMDPDRRVVRFRADSDSEISKGFCWCLVRLLDDAEPDEVLMVKEEHMVGLNVGLNNVVARSRVNTWHNVFFAMQKATQDLVLNMEDDEKKGFRTKVFT